MRIVFEASMVRLVLPMLSHLPLFSVQSDERDVNDKIVVCGARPRQMFDFARRKCSDGRCDVDVLRGELITFSLFLAFYRSTWRSVRDAELDVEFHLHRKCKIIK